MFLNLFKRKNTKPNSSNHTPPYPQVSKPYNLETNTFFPQLLQQTLYNLVFIRMKKSHVNNVPTVFM